MENVTRWSGAEWADQRQEIMLIGAGGIGSWTALNLSRIGHTLYIVDHDVVDETNVSGGQMYRTSDVGRNKVDAVTDVCRDFGCTNKIMPMATEFVKDTGMLDVCITALDNMKTRKLAFETWLEHVGWTERAGLFMDGRLLMESMEVLSVESGNKDKIALYKEKYLFADEEVAELDCTTKQSTFSAMTISGIMTATLCNWLTNNKLEMDVREIPFYQRLHLPSFDYKQINIEQHAEEAISV